MAADICVNVAKYSHATGVLSDNTIPWTHIVASNVCLLLKGEDTDIQNGHLYLQAIQGNTALETIHAGELIDKALETRHALQKAGTAPQIEQLPIFGICKDMLLALRYRLPDGQVARRVQFRLQTTQDCSRIVGVLQKRGMEFQQQRPRNARPSTGRPGTTGSEGRLLTMQTSSPDGSGPAVSGDTTKPNPFRLQTLEAGGLSSQFESSTNASLANQTLPQPLSYAKSTHEASPTYSRSAVNQTPGFGALHSLPVLGVSTHSAPAELTYESAVSHERNQTAKEPAIVFKKQMSHPSSGSTSASDVTWRTPYSNSSDPPRAASAGALAYSNDISIAMRPSFPDSMGVLEILEHEIPPRRELPFKPPNSHSSASSRPSTTTKAGNSSTTVDPGSERPIATTASTFASRPMTASPLKRAMLHSGDMPSKKASTIPDRPQTSTLPSTVSQSKTPSSIRPPVPTGTFRHPSDMGDLLRRSKPLADRSPNSNRVARLDSLADCPYELETPPGTSSGPNKLAEIASISLPRNTGDVLSSPEKGDGITGSLPIQQLTGVENEPPSRAATAVGGPKISSDVSLLADYAAQSQEDRQAILDEFMVSKLEDPNFAVLCEDLDSCWRRIALGL
ncbi:hypothetical protein Q7P37_000423 [Cladosporium fusiforme]